MNRKARRREQVHLEKVHSLLERRLASKRKQLENLPYGSDEKTVILSEIDKIVAEAEKVEARHDELGLEGVMKKLRATIPAPTPTI